MLSGNFLKWVWEWMSGLDYRQVSKFVGEN